MSSLLESKFVNIVPKINEIENKIEEEEKLGHKDDSVKTKKCIRRFSILASIASLIGIVFSATYYALQIDAITNSTLFI